MGGELSVDVVAPWQAPANSGLSLIFKTGQRPSAGDVVRLAELRDNSTPDNRAPGFAVSRQSQPAAGWVELLAYGLTFDLAGLTPAAPVPLPETAHFYGFSARPTFDRAEAITLVPGQQSRAAGKLLPVIRIMTGLATRLAGLGGVTAVVWHPARCVLAPATFISIIGSWLNGGAFPALGLTALFRDSDGAICSEGLAFFIGKELRIEPNPGKNTAEDAKIATRLINQLVGSHAIHQPAEFMGPNGEYLSVEPSENGGLLRVWRKS